MAVGFLFSGCGGLFNFKSASIAFIHPDFLQIPLHLRYVIVYIVYKITNAQ